LKKKLKPILQTVSIPAELCELLKKYRKHWLEQRFKLGSIWQETERLMIQWDGKAMFPATLSHWFSKFLKKNDLPQITFHELRHTSATLLINLGIDVATVAKRLGHAQNTTTLNFYTHAISSADEVAAERLGGLVYISSPKQRQERVPKLYGTSESSVSGNI
jgi:integrase